MTTLVPTEIQVFVGLRRVATRASEGIEANDTVEVVKFSGCGCGKPHQFYNGYTSGHVHLKNLRTGKISEHGACVLGKGFLETVAPPIPPSALEPLKLTRRPLKAKGKLNVKALKNPKLRVRVTREDISEAAKAVRTPGARRTECCVISRALARELRQRFRRHPGLNVSTGYSGFQIRDADKKPVSEDVKLPEIARYLILRFDRRTHSDNLSTSDLAPIEFEVDLTTGMDVK